MCRVEDAYTAAVLGSLALAAASLAPQAPGLLAGCLPGAGAGAAALSAAYGAAALVAAFALDVVRDALGRGRAGATTFRQLNLGLALSALGQLALLLRAQSTGVLAADSALAAAHMAGGAATAALALYTYATATKK